MSRPHLSARLQAHVLADAGHRCGYCHSDERLTGMALSVEHLLPRALGGATVRENLWRSCRACNEQKGTQVHAADPETGEMVPLYNPRLQPWNAHFCWSRDGAQLMGRTATGRATIEALQLNRPVLVAARRRWVLVGWHPPPGDALLTERSG
jgi:hypothetical protein